MNKYYYGIRNAADLLNIIEDVATVFPASNIEYTKAALFGTACAETLAGTYRDATPDSHGVGVTQIDEIAFKDIKQRTKKEHVETIKAVFEINIKSVKYTELSRNPLLSVLFTRLHYMLIEAPFPDNRDDLAVYWKEHYNRSGKGTAKKFIERCQEVVKTLEENVQWLS